MTKYESIKACIKFLPALKIGFLGHCDNELFALLDEELNRVGGELVAFIYDEAPKERPTLSVKMMGDYSKSFRTIAREYEIFIINDIFYKIESIERTLKSAFKALENSGELLVLESSKDGIETALAEYGFVAINEVETSEAGHIISAKKMHGWGHGL